MSHKILSNFNGYLYTHKCTKSCEVNHHSLDSEIAERPKFTSVCVLLGVPHWLCRKPYILDCFLLLFCRGGACPDLNNLHEATNNTEFE